MMFVCSLKSGVETTRKHVLFDLPIPLVGHEFFEPPRETGEFVGREASHHRFEILAAHNREFGSFPSVLKWLCAAA